MDEKLLRISDLEKMTGFKRRTIHYYMQEGLLSPPRRTGKTMAYYGRVHVDELEEIKRLRGEAYPIALIREVMNGGKSRQPLVVAETEAEAGKVRPERKQQIVDEAVEVFTRKGYGQTKITDITGAVGVGQSTFYLYFPSKKALFLECVEQVFQSMFQDFWAEIKDEKHPLQRLRKRAEIVLKSHPEFIDMLQILRMAQEDDPDIEKKSRHVYVSIMETLKKDFLRAIELGYISPAPPEEQVDLICYFLMGFIETGALILKMDPRYDVDNLLDAIENLPYFNFRDRRP